METKHLQAIAQWRKAIHAILAGVCLWALVPSASCATYYVDASAPNDNGAGSRTSPKKYLTSGIALMSQEGGDTLILASGRYAGAKNSITPSTRLRNGRAGAKGGPDAYNVVRAAIDGSVTVTGNLDLPLSSAYLQFEGIKWTAADQKNIVGHHLKFLRCAFKNGPPTGNNVSVVVGTNDQTPGAHDILIEDSWVYGPGGRYKVLVFNSRNVVLRRVVVRHDGGWIPSNEDPQAGIAIYNSPDVELQNALVIDSTLQYPGWLGAIAHVQNDLRGTLENADARVRGSIVLNIADVGVSYEGNGSIRDAQIANTVIWKVARSALTLNGGSHNVRADRLTVGEVSGSSAINVFGGSASTLDVTHSILHRVAREAFRRNRGTLSESINNCFATSGSVGCAGPGDTALDALTNGLKFLPRVEPDSKLGEAGMGAVVTTRIGTQGTLYGEPGYDSPTGEDLWPWPNQDRLRADFCEDGVTRGLCGTPLSLTNYIWSFLGSAWPIRP